MHICISDLYNIRLIVKPQEMQSMADANEMQSMADANNLRQMLMR